MGVCVWVVSSMADSDRLAVLELEELMRVPVESVSGVSKYEQSIRRAPAGVTVFTAEDFRRNGWRTLADALRAAPGMHVRNDRFYEYLGNRGFTRPLDYNSRTLILVDGHRLNDAIYQQGSIGTDFILDPEMIERVEIIQGPGSSVYGSSAFFGAINIVPRRGRDLGRGEVSTTVSSEPGLKTRVSVGNRTDAGVEYTVSATEEYSRGERDFALGADWRARHPSFTARTISDENDLHRQLVYGHVSWRGLEGEAGYVRRRQEVPPSVYFTSADRPSLGIDERAFALVRTRVELPGRQEIDARLALDHYRYDGNFTPPDESGTLETLMPSARALSVSGEVRWLGLLAERHRIIAGFEYQANLRQDLERFNAATGTMEVRVRESSTYYSPFAQMDWEIAPPLVFSLGGRVDVPGDYDPRFTPRVGIIWEATKNSTLKLLYGESFRSPNIEERYAGEDGLVANPDLGPETNKSWELIAERRFGAVLRTEVRLYRVESDRLITDRLTGTNPLLPDEITLVNHDTYLTRGGDFTTSAIFQNGVELMASVTLQRTEDRASGRTVTDAPDRLGKLSASVPLVTTRLRLTGEVQHVASRLDVNGNTAEDYTVANLTLRFAPVWRRWEFTASVYNLADAEWEDPKNRGVIVNPPRSFALRATCSF